MLEHSSVCLQHQFSAHVWEGAQIIDQRYAVIKAIAIPDQLYFMNKQFTNKSS